MSQASNAEKDGQNLEVLSIVFDVKPDRFKIYQHLARAYFKYYHGFISGGYHVEHRDMMSLINLLRKHSSAPKKDVESKLMDYCQTPRLERQFGTAEGDIGISEKLAHDLMTSKDIKVTPAKVLAIAVQVMLAIKLDSGVEGGLGFPWKEELSLEETVREIFLPDKDGEVPSMPIRKSKLRARYLKDYANAKLIWTNNLSDHLMLNTEKVPKELYIFQYVSQLEASLERTAGQKMLVKPDGVLVMERAFYDADFIWETLMTYRLLFPFEDHDWLDKMIKRGSETDPKDPRLTSPANIDIPWDQRAYKRPIRTSSELFKRYPRWAVRLQLIFDEADDPTPIGAIGRWIDRHRASRHSFGITVLAFTVTILFGVISLAVGGTQIWIAYCTWHSTDSGICWT